MMGWLTRGPGEVKDSSGLLRFFNPTTPDPEYPASTFLNHVSQGYDKNELVYACIAEKATSGPEATLRVYDALGRRGEPLQDHPVRRLLAEPNPLLTEFELFELLYLHLDLAGNAFWELVRDRAGRVTELWPLRPDLVRLVRGRRAVSYRYVVSEVDGSTAATVPVEVLHFRLPNPVDPLVGTPPMRAALRATALDNEATDFVKALLQNHAIPGVVVTMADLQTVLDESVTNRLKAKWKASYGGRNRGEPAFLQAGMDVKELGLNLRDLEFPDLRTISESRICMSFGVPPILVGAKVGLDRSTFANYGEARRSFWEETLMPMQRRIRDTIAKALLPLVAPPTTGRRRVSLRWDHSEVLALQESEQSRWDRATRAFQVGGLTVNDYRREIGLPDVTGGDVFLVPSGVIATRDVSGVLEQVNGQQQGTQQNQPPADQQQDDSAPKAGPWSRSDIERWNDKVLDDLIEDSKAADQVRDRNTKRHRRVLAEYMSARRRDAVRAIGGKATPVDRQQWDADLTERLYKVGLQASSEAGADVSDVYDAVRTEAYQYARAKGIASDINTALVEAVLAALVDPDPAQAVGDLFDSYESDGVDRYATTLVTAALAWGATEAGRQLVQGRGGTATKTWLTRSRNPRPSHARMNGVTVPIDDAFPNGMNWPGDPSGGPDEVAECQCGVEVRWSE